jgi:hypothetical protein
MQRDEGGGAGMAALITLLRLRRFEAAVARRHLAERIGAAAAAEARHDAAAETLRTEAAIAAAAREGGATSYAAWLPRGLAAYGRATAALRLEETRLASAQAGLAAAHLAERAVVELAQQRAAAARRQAERQAQRRLDEMAATAAWRQDTTARR